MYKYIRGFSEKLSNIGARMNDLSMQIIRHLIKIYLYSDDISINHWITEIYSFLNEVKLVKGTNKPPKAKYIYKYTYLLNENYARNVVRAVIGDYKPAEYDDSLFEFISDYFKWLSEQLSMYQSIAYPDTKSLIVQLLKKYDRI